MKKELTAEYFSNADMVVDIVSERSATSRERFFSKRIKYSDTKSVYMSMYLVFYFFSKMAGRIERKYSLAEIGLFFSKKHSLIKHAIEKIEDWCSVYSDEEMERKMYHKLIRDMYEQIGRNNIETTEHNQGR